jgi:multicomponent Na+:H+ antiporter subunit D
MIGLPPAAGFVSKWYLVSGALEAGHWLALGVIVASTLLNAGYFLPIVYRAFFREANGEAHGEAPLSMVLALVATAALTIAMFFWADVPLALARGMLG